MKKSKKILSLVLAVALLISALPTVAFNITASANDEFTEGYYTYTVSNGEATITEFDESISGNLYPFCNLFLAFNYNACNFKIYFSLQC